MADKPKPQEWIDGFEQAERQFFGALESRLENPDLSNPFEKSSEAYEGWLAAAYIIIQK